MIIGWRLGDYWMIIGWLLIIMICIYIYICIIQCICMCIYTYRKQCMGCKQHFSSKHIVHNKDQHRTIVQPGDAEQYTSGLNPKYRYIRYVSNRDPTGTGIGWVLVPLADWTGTHHELHPKKLREIHPIYSINSLIRGITTNCFCEFNLSFAE